MYYVNIVCKYILNISDDFCFLLKFYLPIFCKLLSLLVMVGTTIFESSHEDFSI